MILPTLTPKQQAFVMFYITNGNNATAAYKSAYDIEKMTDDAIAVEASKLLKNPKVAQWISYYQGKVKQNFEQKALYTTELAMAEYNELKKRVSESLKYCNVEKGIIDSKCKLAGLLTDKVEHSASESLVDFLDKLD